MTSMPPLVIVEGPPAAFERARHEVAMAGWVVVTGFSGPRRPGAVVRVGVVATESDAAASLLAALGGAGLVVHAEAARSVVDRLVDDLRRLGPVDHRNGVQMEPPTVGAEARAILGLLAEGHTLGEAAAILGLARRTADRRLAEGRRALGTDRTTEAIARARRLGWLRPRDLED